MKKMKKEKKKKRLPPVHYELLWLSRLQLSTNFVVILMPRVPGCAQKNTAPRYSPPQQRKNFADNDDEDEQISFYAIWNEALGIRTSDIRTSPAGGGSSSSDGRILGIQSDSLNCACTHTQPPIYIHTNLYPGARLEEEEKARRSSLVVELP
jgi:hypothetical protein